MITLELIKQQAVKALFIAVQNENSCLEYPILRKGYGVMQVQKDKVKYKLAAHRVVYMATHDILLRSDQVVMHKCDNPKCINKDHLILGTHLKNAEDRNSKERQAKGEKHGHCKLTTEQVMIIRSSSSSNASLSREYGVDRALIIRIKARKIWKHLV